MNHDDVTRPSDTRWRHAGSSALIGFKCADCGRNGCDTKGSGIRFVALMGRAKVCRECKERIDSRKA
jgi:hypothetical protein